MDITAVLITLVAGLASASLTPWFASLLADYVTRGSSKAAKQRAFERVRDNPLCCKGARLSALFIDGAGGFAKVMGECKITALKQGYIEVTEFVTKNRMCFTLKEYESFHPIYYPKSKSSPDS